LGSIELQSDNIPKQKKSFEKWNHLIQKIQLISDRQALSDKLEELSNPTQPMILAFANAHAMNSVFKDESFYNNLVKSDLIFRDGSGMAKLYKSIGLNPGLNLNGTDLIPQLIERFSQQKIALLGTQDPYLENAKEMIQNTYACSSSVIKIDGFQTPDVYIQAMLQDKPALIILGMGMPKQEQVAQQLKNNLSHPCLIVCGGAIIDFLGGKVTRAPLWMRNNGIEWLYRLISEPRRMFKRYVIGNPLFLMRVSKFKNRML